MSVIRRTLEATKRRFPGIYFQARRAAALASWYLARRREATGFDESFWERNEAGDWDGFARAVLRRCPASSVLDVGCGDGKLLAAMGRVSPGLRAVGVDASPAALARAKARGVDARALDLAGSSMAAVRAFAGRLGSFDLAVSFETVEHIPPWHSEKLLRLLAACAPVIVFSGAQPLQGGVLHVNERPLAYWRRRFRKMGYESASSSEALRADLRALALPPWYAANVNVFVRREG